MKQPFCLKTLTKQLHRQFSNFRCVFWLDMRGSLFESWATLESYSLVKEERKLLLNITSSFAEEAGRPTSLTADVKEKRLYWVDAR